MNFKTLTSSARLAIWRRHGYRSIFDIPKDFLLRLSTDWYGGRAPPKQWPLAVRLRALSDPVYLRVGDSDILVLDEIFTRSEYGRIQEWNLPDDATIVDLGANIGLASLYFASLYPKSQIVAVEPGEGNCRMIERNCRRMIDEKRLQLRHAFIAGSDGVAGLDPNSRAWALEKSDKVDQQHPMVPCISMSTLIQDSRMDTIDLLKCDVEGTERELFRNCAPWIGKVRHLIVETHNSYRDPTDTYTIEQLYADLRAAGWEFEVLFDLQEELVGIAFLQKRQA